MEQMLQNEPTELSVQAVPQKAVEQACFHALTLISRNCEYLDQHLARTGADQESRQAVTDISAASAQLDRTVNEVMTLLEYLRAEELPRLYPMDLCDLLQQIAAQADMIQEQLKVELTLDYGGWTTCHVLAERSDAELLLLHLLSNALRACSEGGKVQIVLRRSESFWQLTLLDNGCGLPDSGEDAWLRNRQCFLGGARLGLLLPPHGLGPAGGKSAGMRHAGSGDHPAQQRPQRWADGGAARGQRVHADAKAVSAAHHAGEGAAHHAGARRPRRSLTHYKKKSSRAAVRWEHPIRAAALFCAMWQRNFAARKNSAPKAGKFTKCLTFRAENTIFSV